jgi:DNA-binding CsgD family transcriptional regulator
MAAPFVGRARELGEVRALVGDVLRDREAATLLIVGDPGSGKTRLLSEARASLAIDRVAVLVGYEPERRAPLAAASELLQMLSGAGAAGEALGRLLFDPDAGPLDALRVHETAHRALSSLGEILILLDDMQWIDDATLALVRHLIQAGAGEARALVAAARPSEAASMLPGALGAVLAPARVRSIDLGPLARDDAIALVRGLAPGLAAEEAATVAEAAGGSPFWIEALARAGGGRTAAVEDRLSGMSADASWILAALAVAARPMTASELGRLSGWEAPRVAEAVAETVRRGVAIEDLAVRVSHDIVREAAESGLPDAARRRLHGRLAELIESEAGDDVALLRRALEHRRSAGEPAAGLARRMLEAPGRRLLGVEGVRDLVAVADAAPEPEGLVLHSDLAALAFELGEYAFAYDGWIRVAEEAPEVAERAAAALSASRAAYELGRGELARAALARSRSGGGDDPWLAVAQDAHEALLRLWLDRTPAEAEPFAARALEASRAAGTPVGSVARDARRGAVQAAFDLASVAARWAEAGTLADELCDVSRGSEPSFLEASFSAAMHLRRCGRWVEAADALRRVWSRARDRMYPLVAMRAGYALAEALYRLGSLDAAEEVAAASDELGRRIGGLARDTARFWAGWYGTALSRGRWAEAIAALERTAAEEKDAHFRGGAHLEILRALARLDPETRVADVLDRIGRAEADIAAAGCERCRGELLLRAAEASARIGEPDRARALVAEWADAHPETDPVAALIGERALALAAGDLAGLAETVARADSLGLALEGVWARVDLGRALAASDRGAAVAALEDAARRASAIGAVTERMAAERALRGLGVRTWRREAATEVSSLGELTDREREIARLVAGGASNPEVAKALFLSRKTVEHHVSSILTKLGLRNRAELAHLLARNA